MKTTLLILSFLLALASVENTEAALGTPSRKPKKNETLSIGEYFKQGVMKRENRMMEKTEKGWTELLYTYICTDGSTVSKEGKLTRPNGKTMKLANDQGLDMEGVLVEVVK